MDLAAAPDTFSVSASPGFAAWLAAQNASIAFATPPSKLFLVGIRPDGELGVFERTFDKTMGLAREGTDRIYMGLRHQVWRLENVLPPPDRLEQGFDRCFVPRQVHTIGDVNVHDVSVAPDGDVWFVNTRFGCLSRLSDEHTFDPAWSPPYLPGPANGDRCHLNGLAMGPQGPLFASSVSETDAIDSWRDHRSGGGVVTHIPSGEVVARGFSMPHSPRWYDDRLWITNSGTGDLCLVDPDPGTFEPVAFIPGFPRGLSFINHYAVVGSSKPREGDLYSGLGLGERLADMGLEPQLGIFVVDLQTGGVVEWMVVDGPMRELFDVITLPGVRRAMAVGLVSDEIERTHWIDSSSMRRTDAGTWDHVGTGEAGDATRAVAEVDALGRDGGVSG